MKNEAIFFVYNAVKKRLENVLYLGYDCACLEIIIFHGPLGNSWAVCVVFCR